MIDYAQSIKTNSPVVYRDHTAHPSRWVSYMYSTVSIINHGEGLTDKAGRKAGKAGKARQGKARQGKARQCGKAGQAVDNQNSVRSRGLLGVIGCASGV